MPPDEYPEFGHKIVEEVFEKFQSNEAPVPNPIASMPPDKNTTFVACQHQKVPMPKRIVKPINTEPEIIDVFHQPSLPPLDFSTPLLASLNLYQQLLWEQSQWDLEIKRLQRIIKEQAQVIEEKDNEVIVLQQRVTRMIELIPKLMQFKSPSPMYTLFLKEQMVNFQFF